MGKWRGRLYKTDRARDFDHERDRHVRTRQVYETIDRQPFQWIVTLVAGIGFFLDGYTLFASNLALPMIAYVYWQDDVSSHRLTWINIATLAGTLVGQILFGVLADQKGRKKMYGVELIVILGSTLGVVMSSSGAHDSMSIFTWLIVWRFVVGVGVGGDYPVSAVITSEFAPTRHRARMLATVFFMQPLGQVAGNLVTILIVSVTRNSLGDKDLTRAVDIMWRSIIGIGVVPGILAVLFRLAIPETPRFMLDIKDDPVKAECDASYLFGNDLEEADHVSPVSVELGRGTWALDTKVTPLHRPTLSTSSAKSNFVYENEFSPTSAFSSVDWTVANTRPPTLNSKWAITRADIHQYFLKEGNWRTLLGTSLTWFFLDFAFYGIGFSSPQFLAQTWGTLDTSNSTGALPPWQTSSDSSVSIYTSFWTTSMHALVILNAGSLLGGILLILLINRLNRVSLQKYMFLFLAALFIAMGTMFLASDNYRGGPLAIALFILAQVAFNFGPNATTYILPAELFPTRYRATCHGISAASGKLGSILMQLVAAYYKIESEADVDSTSRYGRVLIIFSAFMLVGFAVTWFAVPNVQHVDGLGNDGHRQKKSWREVGLKKSRTLEELSLGRAGPKSFIVFRTGRGGWI